MSTQTLGKVRVVKGGIDAVVVEAASQSFKEGQLLSISSGQVSAVASDATGIYAVALSDASGTTNAAIKVKVIMQDTLLYGNVYHATATSAITARANVGVKYALYVANNKCHVDIGDESNDAVVIVALDEGEVGDAYGHCYFRVINAALQSDAGAA